MGKTVPGSFGVLSEIFDKIVSALFLLHVSSSHRLGMDGENKSWHTFALPTLLFLSKSRITMNLP
jgi:hypothetical protein